MVRTSTHDRSVISSRSSIAQVQVKPVSFPTVSPPSSSSSSASFLGISRQWFRQLGLLAINLIGCGGIVGLSRLLPQLAEEQFHQHSYSAVLFFIVTFGLFKGVFNLLVGTLANQYGRRFLLLVGWSLSYVTPMLIWFALQFRLSWSWIIGSTSLLGASQGLCTSCVVIMVMDIVPQRARGISMGVLECMIYVSLGLCALLANSIQSRWHDFRMVLIVHIFLCSMGMIAAWYCHETQPMLISSHAPVGVGSINSVNGGVVSHTDSSFDADKDGSLTNEHTPSLRQYGNTTSSGGGDGDSSTDTDHDVEHGLEDERRNVHPHHTLLKWDSLRDDDPDDTNHENVDPSILPSLTLHPIPGSPMTPATPLQDDVDSNGQSNFPNMNTSIITSATAADVTATSIVNTNPSSKAIVGIHSTVTPRRPSLSGSGGDAARRTPSPALHHHHRRVSSIHDASTPSSSSSPPLAGESFFVSFKLSLVRTFSSSILCAILQAGFFNNFKDGVLWGILPAFFGPISLNHVSSNELGILLTIYPMCWGLGQLVTGRLSDQYGRRRFIIAGLLCQACGIGGIVFTRQGVDWIGKVLWPEMHAGGAGGGVSTSSSSSLLTRSMLITASEPSNNIHTSEFIQSVRFVIWSLQLFLVGLGTALSYPVLQAYIGDYVAPLHRAGSIGVYRLCRDLGYAIGGILSGLVADLYGIDHCLILMSLLLIGSALWSFVVLPKEEIEGGMTASGQKEAQ